MRTWMLLVYKVPRDPTSARVAVWRKLKKLGSVLLHDSVWALPATPRTQEHFQWLAAEIVELDGEASVSESHLMLVLDVDDLVAQFNQNIEPQYRELLADLNRKKTDLADVSRRYQQVRSQDYFDSELGRRVREALIAAKGGPP
jgi:hypothetical protein